MDEALEKVTPMNTNISEFSKFINNTLHIIDKMD